MFEKSRNEHDMQNYSYIKVSDFFHYILEHRNNLSKFNDDDIDNIIL